MNKKVVRQTVNVNKLIKAPYNPPGRTSPERTRNLETSMEFFGMLSPILINSKMMVIDGHRRLAIAKRLKWTEVECAVVDSETPESIYASVNVTARRMSGNDALGVWLKQPLAVTHAVGKQFEKMREAIGPRLVQEIYKSGCSIRVYRTALHIAKYCDCQDAVAEVTEWLLNFAAIGHVMKALDAGVDAKKIMKAVKSRQPIRLKLDVA